MKGLQVNDTAQFEHSIKLSGKQARYYDFAQLHTTSDSTVLEIESSNNQPQPKPMAHFYGGNGFTVGVYQPLLSALSDQFHVTSLAMRGYWHDLPQDKVMTREQDADMLIEFLEQTQSGPVIGIGHSQGATATALAAAKRPDLFCAIYLIDPVTFTKAQSLLYSRIPKRVLLTRQPFKSTKVKQADWESVEAYYQHLRAQSPFRRISDENLRLFAANSLIEKPEGGFTLLFGPQYELASYFGTPYITPALKKLNQLNLPYHLILAKPTMFVSDDVRKSWQGIVPRDRITTLADYGHLVPMEAPEQCAKLIFKLQSR
ncbi:alpha/beta fold hydrolase [Psychrobacter raelei]|uniref:alpha/beta fold hydrolase n=1 Tax=Psychrobacter raelei TaxID=2565531 RepID=UPI003F605ED5